MLKKFIPSPLEIGKREDMRPPAKIGLPRGLFVAWLFIRVVCRVWLTRLGIEALSRAFGKVVASELQRLGGLWIKVGQSLAAGAHAYPRAFCKELENIRDDAIRFSGETAKDIIGKEIGSSASDIFREFDVVPVACSSFAQVHVAWLCENDTKVAIKIQRPQAREEFSWDLLIFTRMVVCLRLLSMCRWAKLAELQATLADLRTVEFDYRIRAGMMRTMRRELKPKKILVPKVFPQYGTERLLVMGFVDGIYLDDYYRAVAKAPKKVAKWRRDNGIDPEKLHRRLTELDRIRTRSAALGPVPAGVVLLRRNRIAIVDFGSWTTVKGMSDDT